MGTQNKDTPKAKAKEKPKPPERDDREDWGIPLRGAFGMPADLFLPAGYLPPGLRGSCRYHFDGPPEDPTTGRLECHDADKYRYVLIALPCLAELKPPRSARFDGPRSDPGDGCKR